MIVYKVFANVDYETEDAEPSAWFPTLASARRWAREMLSEYQSDTTGYCEITRQNLPKPSRAQVVRCLNRKFYVTHGGQTPLERWYYIKTPKGRLVFHREPTR